ncbi:MAG: efflux RND transporter periplasmic adaptor subunit [Succinivibrio sp.]|jgi:membrane fusion protein (multidrug efflux system)|nr:efflux RND transporter periplasmic adaptor subunit [Succinivibrio sp.]
MRKNLKIASLLPCVALLALALAGCEKQAEQQMQALPVDVFTVTTMDVPVVSHLTGRANPTRMAEVRPQVSGVIQRRLFTEGSTVKQGDQLYQIDPALYEAQVASAQAALSSAKATLHSSQLKAERYANLLEKKAVSKQDYDDAQATYLANKAAVESAQAALQTAQINLAYTKVYAPISGTINRSNVTEGALVSAQQATALTTITQLDPMYVDLGQTVEDNLALKRALHNGKLKTGADGKPAVDIYFSNGDKYPEQGELEFAEVSVDQSTGMVNLRAQVPNPHNVLLPGMFLRADINEGVTPDAPVMLASGVQREATGASYALIVNDKGVVERKDIAIGPQYEKYYVVLNGLKKGDKVIVSNVQKIREGMPVQPVEYKEQKTVELIPVTDEDKKE